ncbi:AAA family ATPase [Candidatus Saccharibacteria bacterium]|nr:AAA family ATPase [Candidatus Saccharibacteria bacterium]
MGKLWGFVVGGLYRIYPPTREKLEDIAKDILWEASNAPRRRIFVMMVGRSLSGKTWFVEHHGELSRFFQVSTRRIHDLLNSRFPLLDDDKTVDGQGYWPRQALTRYLREEIFKEVCKWGIAMVSDSGNQIRVERERRLRVPRKYGYKTAIVWVLCDREVLIQRCLGLDAQLEKRGEKPTWLALYKRQLKRFQPPAQFEADELMIFQSELDNPEEFEF